MRSVVRVVASRCSCRVWYAPCRSARYDVLRHGIFHGGFDVVDWLKKNWILSASLLVALVCGADVIAGLRAGKSLSNITVLPSLGIGGASVLAMLFRWINSRTVITREIPAGLDAQTLRLMEALFSVASHPDVTPDMVTDLSNMAAASVVGHANRVKTERLAGRVEVIPKALAQFPDDFAAQVALLRSLKERTEGVV